MGESVGISASETFSATKRLLKCGLVVQTPKFRPIAGNLREFLTSGLRYVFPSETGKLVRGFVTGQDAAPLAAQLVRLPGEPPLVWPNPDGDVRGISLTPLYRSAPDAARRDARLYAWLALADALRVGDSRVRTLAAAEVAKLATALENARVR